MRTRKPKAFFIDVPLVLISQIWRSGGSLLAQLFDSHPQVYAHPSEMRIWHRKKKRWPLFDPADDPSEWFELLDHSRWRRFADLGISKPGKNPHATQRHPFTFSVIEQRMLFLELVRSRPITCSRDILNCYFTSFFASWGESQPTGRELAITGFMPRTMMVRRSQEQFRHDYPDGKLITILRDPRSWYASSKLAVYSADRSPDRAVSHWIRNARRTEELVRSGGSWVLALTFDDLVLDPETTMRRIASFAGIEFDPCLLVPSYAGRPVLPNSSFAVSEYGINPETARRQDQIPADARELIAREAQPLYESLAKLLAAPARSMPPG